MNQAIPMKINITDMLNVSRRLIQLLCQESAFIKKMQLSKLSELAQEKLILAEAMEDYKSIFTMHPEVLNDLSAQQKEEIKRQFIAFEEAVEENAYQLRRAKEVHNIVIDAIRTALHKKVSADKNYGNNGIVNQQKNDKSQVPAVSLCEQF
ncbi:hypothetical protein N9W34_02805 [Rickettsiales bacterium]|nr:hypothetical protein [Rickettsiales bacterium]